MKFFKKKRIFLDYASITPVDKRVKKEIDRVERLCFANPSALYTEALVAKDIVSKSREKIASLINAQKSEIVFTSGGTEGNNLALLGVFEAFGSSAPKSLYKSDLYSNSKSHIITTNIEHPAILEVCKEIERRGGEVTYLPVSSEGLVNPKDVRDAIKENTVLVSIAYANNEIGTIQPIKEISRVIKEYRKDFRQKNKINLPYFHTDACQGVTLTLDVQKLGVDMMTLDGIKMYGPRGIGFLYVKSGTEISPVIFGGGQERGLRSGTENVPAIAGLARALEIGEEMKEKPARNALHPPAAMQQLRAGSDAGGESARLIEIRDYAIENILKTFPNATLNGSRDYRLPNNINICFPDLDAEFAVISLDVAGISASYSSSCRTLKKDSSSYVVENLGKKDCSSSSLRFTLGRESKKSDIDVLIKVLKTIVKSVI